jgi:hypothetical protein
LYAILKLGSLLLTSDWDSFKHTGTEKLPKSRHICE